MNVFSLGFLITYQENWAEASHPPYRPRPLWSQEVCPRCPALSEQSWQDKRLLSWSNSDWPQTEWARVALGAYAEKPLTMWAYLTKIRSSQPQRLLRPVVTPNSLPLDCSRSPVSWNNATKCKCIVKNVGGSRKSKAKRKCHSCGRWRLNEGRYAYIFSFLPTNLDRTRCALFMINRCSKWTAEMFITWLLSNLISLRW